MLKANAQQSAAAKLKTVLTFIVFSVIEVFRSNDSRFVKENLSFYLLMRYLLKFIRKNP